MKLRETLQNTLILLTLVQIYHQIDSFIKQDQEILIVSGNHFIIPLQDGVRVSPQIGFHSPVFQVLEVVLRPVDKMYLHKVFP